jgi:hypothetical protein
LGLPASLHGFHDGPLIAKLHGGAAEDGSW